MLAHQRLEAAIGGRDVGERKIDQFGAQRAGAQGARLRIIAEQGVELRSVVSFRHGALYSAAVEDACARRALSRL